MILNAFKFLNTDNHLKDLKFIDLVAPNSFVADVLDLADCFSGAFAETFEGCFDGIDDFEALFGAVAFTGAAAFTDAFGAAWAFDLIVSRLNPSNLSLNFTASSLYWGLDFILAFILPWI